MGEPLKVFSRATWIRLIVGFCAAFATGVLIALGIKHSGGWESGTAWDIRVLERAHAATAPRWLDRALLFAPWLGTNITIFALLIPYGAWLRRHHRTDILAQLGAAAVGNYLLNLVMKAMFGRPRPSIFPRRGEYTWASYPSGHVIAMLSVLLFAAWLLHRERGTTWPYFVWVPAFVAMLYSRVYLGVHWPTDVLGGFAIGIVWLLTVWLTFRRPDWSSRAGEPDSAAAFPGDF